MLAKAMFLCRLKEDIRFKRQSFIKKSSGENSSPNRNLAVIFKNREKEVFGYC